MEHWKRVHGAFLGLMHMFWTLPAVSVLNLCPDVMHLLDLGVAHHILGNVIFELIYIVGYLEGRTLDNRREALWSKISSQYQHRGTPTQLSNLEFTFFCDPTAPHQSYPVLTTRVKAAETRRRHEL